MLKSLLYLIVSWFRFMLLLLMEFASGIAQTWFLAELQASDQVLMIYLELFCYIFVHKRISTYELQIKTLFIYNRSLA